MRTTRFVRAWERGSVSACISETLPRSHAFTLIELVISSALMAMMLTAAYCCLSSGIFSQKLVESRAEVVQTARVTMALMTADLRCACPLTKNLEFLGMHRMLGDIEADNMDEDRGI